jgi:two-component system, OmpR family, alkaline phosphatase synthesis response regulator PhoP
MNQTLVLLVEDEQYLRELYQEILAEQGYTVDTAADGEEGFNKVKHGGYDLVILDIILPKMNGLEIMRKIKSENPLKPNKKIVFLTNLDKDEEIKEALQLGDGYFIKSQITPGSLVNELKAYLTPSTGEVTPAPAIGDAPVVAAEVTIAPPVTPAAPTPEVAGTTSAS